METVIFGSKLMSFDNFIVNFLDAIVANYRFTKAVHQCYEND